MVDVSRRAGPPVRGSVVATQAACLASGGSGVPLGAKSSVSGSTKGSSDSAMPTAWSEPSG
jgi:hypothetical protein